MFSWCTSITGIPLFNTSNVTRMDSMFSVCTSLESIPLFDTSKVTNINEMFYNCYKVESGALALYQQASTQTNPPSNHSSTFRDCGKDTQTGAAELAQIPSDWK
jgi:surface protein